MFHNSIHPLGPPIPLPTRNPQREPAPSINSADELHLKSHFSDWSSDADADAESVADAEFIAPPAPKRTRVRGRNNIYEHASFRGTVDHYPETNPAVTRNITRHHDDLIEALHARDNHIVDTLVTTENKPRAFICNGVLSETEVDVESIRLFDTEEKPITKKALLLLSFSIVLYHPADPCN